MAKVGDPVNYADVICPPWGLSIEWTGSEIEYQQSRYVSRQELLEAFDPPPEKLPRLSGVAPTQPFVRSPWLTQTMLMAACFGALFVVLTIVSFLRGSVKVKAFGIDQSAGFTSEYVTESFKIDKAPTVCMAGFASPRLSNAWVYLQVALLDTEDQVLLDFSKELSYYSGPGWSEGSRKGNAVFRLEKPGEYRFLIKSEGGRGSQKGRLTSAVTMTLFRGVMLTRYFVILAVLSFGFVAFELIRKARFESRRWAPVTQDDDDDDWD